MYLCAVLDWHSRDVLAWELANTLNDRLGVYLFLFEDVPLCGGDFTPSIPPPSTAAR